jgi:hypothetical protein
MSLIFNLRPRIAMRYRLQIVLFISLVGLVFTGSVSSTRATSAFIVTSTVDVGDAVRGDGVCETVAGNGICTLRAAIQETNAHVGADTITLPAGIYQLTLLGTFEDGAGAGDLDILDDLTILGAGDTQSIIDGNEIDRVFDLTNIVPETVITIDGVRVQHGKPPMYSQERGGGLANGAMLTLRNSTIADNTADVGGGIYNSPFGHLTIDHSTVRNNTAREGGGVDNWASGTLTVVASSFQDNSAATGGGLELNGSAIIRDSTISGNQAQYEGGGIKTSSGRPEFYYHDPGVFITNTTISDNRAGSGGAIYTFGITGLASATVTNNTAIEVGGGVYLANIGISGRSASFLNTIVAGNTDGSGQAPDCGGLPIWSSGYNLIQNITGCVLLGGEFSHNIVGVAPNLGELANNGGPTLTRALLEGSPAIDAAHPDGCTGWDAVPLATDQRGNARVLDGNGDANARCDIGAYEFIPIAQPLPTPSPINVPSPTPITAQPSPHAPPIYLSLVLNK